MSGIINAPSPLSSKKVYKRKKRKKGKALEEKHTEKYSVKYFISNSINSGRRLLLRRRVKPLQNFTVFTI